MSCFEECHYGDSAVSEAVEEERLIEFLPIAKQVRKLAMEAMAKGDKKSNLAYNKVREILKAAPAVGTGCTACDGGFGDNTVEFLEQGYRFCPYCGRKLC